MAETTQVRAGHPRFHQIITEIQDLHDRKNRDYSGGDTSRPLGNFERVAQIEAIYPGFRWDTPFGVAISYLLKQLDAALTLYTTGTTSVTGEGIPQRMRDVAVYAIIAEVIAEDAGGSAAHEEFAAHQEVDGVGGPLYPGEPEDKMVREVWASRYGWGDKEFIERDAGVSFEELITHSKRLCDGRYPSNLTVGEFRRLVKAVGVWSVLDTKAPDGKRVWD